MSLPFGQHRRYSPPVADFIAGRDSLRAAVRFALAPAVAAGYVALHTSAFEKAIILILVAGLMFTAAYYYLTIRRRRRLNQ